MKFEPQDSAEILKGEDGPSGLWFPGKIISKTGGYYVVKYQSAAGVLIEKVEKENVRPKPPFRRGKRWAVGDVAQVFDNWSWRVGKIVKVLSKGNFVVRFVGSIQLKEFHESSLRIWRYWHQNKWSVVGKGAISKNLAKNSVLKKPKLSGRLVHSSNSEVKGRKYPNRSRRLVSTEDSDQCSVASCGSNNMVNSPRRGNCNKAFADLSDNSDAESSFPSIPPNLEMTSSVEEKVGFDIHELEFDAYKSTVRALYASGPLSWEQEALLTNLRLLLHISDEEHLMQLRYLLSSRVR